VVQTRTPPELLVLVPPVAPAAAPVIVQNLVPVIVPAETPPEVYVAPVYVRKQDRN
jgi:hypothetical protein